MKSIERLMVRQLGGELHADEAEELERRLAEDPAAAELFAQMQDRWQSLGDLPAGAGGADLAPQVLAAVRRESGHELGWTAAPAWARVCGGLALVCGSFLGAVLAGSEGWEGELPTGYGVASEVWEEPLSLSESYWIGIESLGPGEGSWEEGRP